MYNIEKIRADFPILSREVNGTELVYLDNAASTQKPQVVIDTVRQVYEEEYANVHRGLHYLSNAATDRYEAVRGKIARFLGAEDENEIVFTSNGTEAFNLIAYSWAMPRLEPGDEILLSVLEHHANIVPWNFLRERCGAVLRWVEPNAEGELDPQAVIDAMGPRTKLVAITHMSNVLGTVVDVAPIIQAARERGICSVIDGCQSSVHMPVDVAKLGCDFFVITGHKLYGPTGSGALYGRAERLAEMRPFKGGGDMIRTVTREGVTYADPPMRFEAGTPNIVQIIGLGAAIDYIESIGIEKIASYENGLRDFAQSRLETLNWLELYGRTPSKSAIFSFNIRGGAHPHDISTIVDRKGIAVRAGHHCAQPLMEHLGVTATCRASFALYNTEEEVEKLVEALALCHDLFG